MELPRDPLNEESRKSDTIAVSGAEVSDPISAEISIRPLSKKTKFCLVLAGLATTAYGLNLIFWKNPTIEVGSFTVLTASLLGAIAISYARSYNLTFSRIRRGIFSTYIDPKV